MIKQKTSTSTKPKSPMRLKKIKKKQIACDNVPFIQFYVLIMLSFPDYLSVVVIKYYTPVLCVYFID